MRRNATHENRGDEDHEPARTHFDKVWNDHVIAALGEDQSLLQIDRLVLLGK